MVILFMLHWTGDIEIRNDAHIHGACFEVNATLLSRIHGKAGSGTSLCFSLCFCQYKSLNVSI